MSTHWKRVSGDYHLDDTIMTRLSTIVCDFSVSHPQFSMHMTTLSSTNTSSQIDMNYLFV